MRRLGAFAIITALAWGMLSLLLPVEPVGIHVRWAPGVTGPRRVELEIRFHLREEAQTDRTTWRYRLTDPSTENIRALVQDAQVEDTDGVDRARYRPARESSWIRRWQIPIFSAASGILGSVLFFILPMLPGILAVARRRAARFLSLVWADLTAATWSNADATSVPPHSPRATAAVLLSAVLISAALTSLAGATFGAAIGALAIVYASGYLVGSLLVARIEGLSFAVIRTVAGLMLTSIGYLLSLALSLPWFVGPGALVILALVLRSRAACAWPQEAVRVGWDCVAAGILAVILLSPIAITFFWMAPGPFPPCSITSTRPTRWRRCMRWWSRTAFPHHP